MALENSEDQNNFSHFFQTLNYAQLFICMNEHTIYFTYIIISFNCITFLDNLLQSFQWFQILVENFEIKNTVLNREDTWKYLLTFLDKIWNLFSPQNRLKLFFLFFFKLFVSRNGWHVYNFLRDSWIGYLHFFPNILSFGHYPMISNQ